MSEPVNLSAQHAAEPSSPPKAPLALPAPGDVEAGVSQLEVNGQSFSLLDTMGPTVVNSDGTLSRIANWSEMIPSERARILRVLGKRNGVRLEAKRAELEGQEAEQGGTGAGQ
ncbi:hypothetical protein JCM3775_000235 [Rhodotorula graminis]|uniref:Uncharacterized protein n=1 Tax=Rhodotorula graminis (strain WP1) TaxID=578459 RepID=A0A0P9H1V7_RHOGW|nr:uncharacterized protein RHOBADRAFT_45288 [Rhodotorula graminis WP1]KPV73992.1 hypothetical protein RHOBADRAFT_45288 [Rhodotorula graminis WP1]